MRQRLSLVLTLAAWLLATGSHWDLVQTFAWGRMIVKSAQTMPFTSAVEKTFTPDAMCRLCHAVADAKQQAAKDPAVPGAKSPEKILLLCTAEPRFCFTIPDLVTGFAGAVARPHTVPRGAPPTPPPRVLA